MLEDRNMAGIWQRGVLSAPQQMSVPHLAALPTLEASGRHAAVAAQHAGRHWPAQELHLWRDLLKDQQQGFT